MNLPPDSPESILIVGTGALACLFAARLSAAGVSVTMLGTWHQGLEALSQRGVTLVEANGSELVYPVRATSDPSSCQGAVYALLLVKSWQTGRAAAQLAECLAPRGVVLTLQNGIGNRETLVEILGEARVALGITTLGANLAGPGRVRASGEGVISLSRHPRIEPLQEILLAAGFTLEETHDPEALVWGKLIINAAVNPLTALLHVPNGELLERSTARQLMVELALEAAAVARAQGLRLPYMDPQAEVETVVRRTAANHSSMLQDVERGAPTEIDSICGAILSLGEQTGVPTPVNRTLWLLVKALRPAQSSEQTIR
jgi:2-dehydropantoate 2-reductase